MHSQTSLLHTNMPLSWDGAIDGLSLLKQELGSPESQQERDRKSRAKQDLASPLLELEMLMRPA